MAAGPAAAVATKIAAAAANPAELQMRKRMSVTACRSLNRCPPGRRHAAADSRPTVEAGEWPGDAGPTAGVFEPHPFVVMPDASTGCEARGKRVGGAGMWWGIGGVGVLLYLVLLVALGVSCLRKGHWIMFIVGIFLPFFWIIGAVLPPARPQSA